MASKLNYPKPHALQGPERLHPPLHWHDKTAIGLDKTAIGIDIEASLDKMAIGAGLELKLASLCPCLPGKLISVLGSRQDFPVVSSRNLKFVHGPAVEKFFTREIVKIAIRAPNPEIEPRLHYLVFETSI